MRRFPIISGYAGYANKMPKNASRVYLFILGRYNKNNVGARFCFMYSIPISVQYIVAEGAQLCPNLLTRITQTKRT